MPPTSASWIDRFPALTMEEQAMTEAMPADRARGAAVAAIDQPAVTTFFDETTFTATHVVADPATGLAAIVDSVLDYDPKSGRTATHSADAVIAFVRQGGLTVEWLLETHAHADHLSAAPYLKDKLGGLVAIGEHIRMVQATFKQVFNAEPGFATDGSQFDHLFKDGERFRIGELGARVMHTPGHTPACVSYLVGDAAFVGDTLFMPDYGTARCDFPGGDARTLYRSIRRLLDLPPDTRIYLCHDYKAPGRDAFAWQTTVADERAGNIHVHDGLGEAAFVAMRTQRDKTLAMPVLILPSVQVNMRAGRLPPPEGNGVVYLKVPVNLL
jgi:glyoxylase-like metal-dependent hydrolase (beta-lactamase superfamily II)